MLKVRDSHLYRSRPEKASVARWPHLLAVFFIVALLALTGSPVAIAQETEPQPETSQQPQSPPSESQPEQPAPEPPDAPPDAAAQPAPREQLPPVPDPAAQSVPVSAEKAKKEAARAPGPCKVETNGDEPLLDRYRRELFETVCEAAAGFDSMFGSRRFDEEARRTNGRLHVRTLWDEDEGFELDGDLNLNVEFPNLDHRINAFLGRDDRNDFVRGRENDLDFLPDFFEREGDEEWLLGFGYRPVRGDNHSVDFDAGIEGTSPIDPFVRGRYRHYALFGEENLFRFRQTVYWTNERDFGTASRVDLERPFGERTLARWTANGAMDGEIEGVDWDTGITLFHGFTRHNAISWYIGVSGETEKEVPLEDYGTRVIYRQRMLRDWFFGEVITGVTWPRDTLAEERHAAFHIGFGFEIQFSGEALGLGSRAPVR